MRVRLFQLAVFLLIGLPVAFVVNFFLKAPDISFVAATLILLFLSNDLLSDGRKENAQLFAYLSALDSTLLALTYRKFGTSAWVTFTAVLGVVILNSIISKRIREKAGEEDEEPPKGA
ncbi:hypothetical protein [Thermococcus sp.]